MSANEIFPVVPTGWRSTTLGELAKESGGSIQTGPFGSQLHAADYVDDGIPSIMPKNICIDGVDTSDIARVSPEDVDRLAKHKVLAGDVVYSRRGDVEKCCLITSEEEGWLCGTGCLRVRVPSSALSPVFLHAYLCHPAVREWIVRHAIGATMPNLNTSILSALPILVPPFDEAESVAGIWAVISKKITLNTQTNQTLEQMAQALFKSWFVDFDPVIDNALDSGFFAQMEAGDGIPEPLAARVNVRKNVRQAMSHGTNQATHSAIGQPLPADIRALFPSSFVEHPDLGWIPEGWESKPVGSVIENVGGGTPKTAAAAYWEGGTYAFCTPKDMSSLTNMVLFNTERQLTKDGVSKISSGILDAGTVLMSSRAPIGYLAIAKQPISVNQGIIALKPNKVFGPEFLLYWLKENIAEVISRANGSTFLEISKKNFREIPFLLPNDKVAKHFGVLAKSYMDLVSVNVQENEGLANLRDTLLPKLLSGELTLSEVYTSDDVALSVVDDIEAR